MTRCSARESSSRFSRSTDVVVSAPTARSRRVLASSRSGDCGPCAKLGAFRRLAKKTSAAALSSAVDATLAAASSSGRANPRRALKALADRAAPDLGYACALEQRQAVRAAQPLERDADAPLRLQTEDATLGAGAEPHQMHAPAQPLPQRPLIERGQPERRRRAGRAPRARRSSSPRTPSPHRPVRRRAGRARPGAYTRTRRSRWGQPVV